MSHENRHGSRLALLACAAAVCVVLLLPGTAHAVFTREFLRQITRTENVAGKLNTKVCSEAEAREPASSCLSPGGIALDGKDNLWVENREDSLAGFASAFEGNVFLESLSGFEGPDRLQALAVQDTGELFFVAGGLRGSGPGEVEVYERDGARRGVWETENPKTHEPEPERFTRPTVTVDNAPEGSLQDPSACGTLPLSPGECFVYVTETGESGGVRRFNQAGAEEPFSYDKECEAVKCEYVSGGKITGSPGSPHTFGFDGVVAVAVDPRGDIFAAAPSHSAVYEFAASGHFVQAFKVDQEAVPRLEGQLGFVTGVAVDAVSDHVLISMTAQPVNGEKVGAVYEFDIATGTYLAEITHGAGGAALEDPGSSSTAPSTGMAVDSHGDLYVVERGFENPGEQLVDVYSNGHYLPTLSLASAGERTGTSAVLHGEVNPESDSNPEHSGISACAFQYVREEQFVKNVEAHEGKESEGFADLSEGGEAQCVPSAGELPANSEFQPVHAEVTGLTAGVTYRYRLVAATPGALGGTAVTPALAFTAPAPPRVLSASASSVSSAFAELDARIAPLGADTSYHFEYLTAAAYAADGSSFSGPDPAAVVPVPDAQIGSGGPTGGASESTVQHIAGLAANTEYHFRVVAENECEPPSEPPKLCVSDGPDETFTTLPAPESGLPDGRAYELVTPAVKEGGSDMFAEKETNQEFKNETSDGTPSEDGEGFLLVTKSAFGPFPGNGYTAYTFHREPTRGEWAYTALTTPALGVQTIQNTSGVVFDPADLSRVAFTDTVGSELSSEGAGFTDLAGPPGAPGGPCATGTPFENALTGGCYIDLHEDPRFHEGETHTETVVVGASHDLTHIILESEDHSLCGPSEAAKKITEGAILCEWTGGYETLENGETRPQLTLINLAPNNNTKPTSTCGARLGNAVTEGVGGSLPGTAHDAVSADGSRVFFTAPQVWGVGARTLSGPGCWDGGTGHAPQLYMRSDGQTVEVSAPEAGVSDPTGQHAAEYAGASEDGSRVFFLTKTELTREAQELALHDLELYEYDTQTGTLTRISGGETGTAAGEVYAVTAIPADGTAVYFLSNGVLAANNGANASHATPGECSISNSISGGEEGFPCNLYRYDTLTGATSYIATVNQRAFTGTYGESRAPVAFADWYASPDGRFLLFKSNRALTPFSNAGSSCPIFSPGSLTHGPCAELYRFDARAGEDGGPVVVCVSCGGESPVGNAGFARSAPRGGPGAGPVAAMSDDGRFVFFDSPSRLVPQAENQTLHVYEWQADGAGGCAQTEGCIRLISSPNDAFPSYFLGYSPYYLPDGERVEGGNVFFGTHAKLVPQQTNSVGNIYDARICDSESPCIQPPVAEAVQCEGGSCQTPPAALNDPSATLLAPPIPPTPAGTTTPQPKKVKPLTRAQRLAKALRACRRDHNTHKRTACVKRARQHYAPKHKRKGKKASRSVHRGGGR
jgi:hypothetical protein